MRGALLIGWRYLLFHRIKTGLLIACITMVFFLPIALRILVQHTERQLSARAEATPLIIGAKGSPLELTLNSLYFSTKVPERFAYGESSLVDESGLAAAIPLYVRYQVRRHPIVGTTLDYFDFRELALDEGSLMQRLGDCVVGARFAEREKIKPGDSVVSSPETVFDLAGTYPLKMRVTGVLLPNNSPDDNAVFTDIKTTWIIEGLAHGHTDLADPAERAGVLKRDGSRITANASVVQYNEITEANIDSFHFHGDTSSFPITAVIADPNDEKSGAILMGRYLEDEDPRQIIKPRIVVDELLATILTVQRYVTMGMTVLGAATLATTAMVFLLSLRLRRREFATLHKIGGQNGVVLVIGLFEIGFVVLSSTVLAALLSLTLSWAGPGLLRLFL